jgi:hypothetical protein
MQTPRPNMGEFLIALSCQYPHQKMILEIFRGFGYVASEVHRLAHASAPGSSTFMMLDVATATRKTLAPSFICLSLGVAFPC